MEIRKERGFPQWLEKSRAKDARLFHSSHRPDGVDQLRLTSRVVGPNQTIERGQIKLTEAWESIKHVLRCKYPPAKPGALVCEPLKAAVRGR